MKARSRTELAEAYLSSLEDEERPVYRELIACLSQWGYRPYKDKENLVFKHDLHNKQMAKMGRKRGKNPAPFFSLRFSACRGYSQRFREIVDAHIARYPAKAAGCTGGGCDHCGGEAETHVYRHSDPRAEHDGHCGAYALEIPGVGAGDLEEIKELVREEHAYLMKHEAGVPVE